MTNGIGPYTSAEDSPPASEGEARVEAAPPPPPDGAPEAVVIAPAYRVIKGKHDLRFSCPECAGGLCDCIYDARRAAKRLGHGARVLSPAGVELIRMEKLR